MTVFPACCGYGGNLALPRAGDGQRIYGASPEQPLEAVAAVVRGTGMETGQRRVARRGVPGLLLMLRGCPLGRPERSSCRPCVGASSVSDGRRGRKQS